MQYEIEIRKKAEKDLASIPKTDAQRVADAIFFTEKWSCWRYKKIKQFFPRVSASGWQLADPF